MSTYLTIYIFNNFYFGSILLESVSIMRQTLADINLLRRHFTVTHLEVRRFFLKIISSSLAQHAPRELLWFSCVRRKHLYFSSISSADYFSGWILGQCHSNIWCAKQGRIVYKLENTFKHISPIKLLVDCVQQYRNDQ
jgi:hypothetical protein